MNLLSFCNQLFIGAGFSAVLGCGIAIVHCSINAVKDIKGKNQTVVENVIWCAAYLIAWFVGIIMTIKSGTYTHWEFITLVTTFFYFGTVFFVNENKIRWCTLGNSAGFLLYNIVNSNIAAIAQVLSIISTVVALIRFREKKGAGKELNINQE